MQNCSRFIIPFQASCTIAVNLCEQGDHTFVFAHRKQEQSHVASEPKTFTLLSYLEVLQYSSLLEC